MNSGTFSVQFWNSSFEVWSQCVELCTWAKTAYLGIWMTARELRFDPTDESFGWMGEITLHCDGGSAASEIVDLLDRVDEAASFATVHLNSASLSVVRAALDFVEEYTEEDPRRVTLMLGKVEPTGPDGALECRPLELVCNLRDLPFRFVHDLASTLGPALRGPAARPGLPPRPWVRTRTKNKRRTR